MINIEELRKIAVEMCDESSIELLDAAEAVQNYSLLPSIAFVGNNNSNKEKLVSQIFEADITASKMPIRLAFKLAEHDARFECLNALNGKWQSLVEFIYLLSESDIKYLSRIESVKLGIFHWFYVVNELMPISKTDLDILKLLPPERTTVILHQIYDDIIDESEREKILNYTTSICSKLGLSEPVVLNTKLEMSSATKTIRNLISQDEQLLSLRNEIAEELKAEALRAVGKIIEREIEQNKADQINASKKYTDINIVRKVTLWQSLRTSIIEKRVEFPKKIEEYFISLTPAVAKALYSSGLEKRFSKTWREEILPVQVNLELQKVIEKNKSRIIKAVNNDIASIRESVKELDILPDDTVETILPSDDFSTEDIDLNQGKIDSADFVKIASVAASTLGGAFALSLLSVPHVLQVGTIAVGSAALAAIYDSSKNEAWEKAVFEYSKNIMTKFGSCAKSSLAELYDNAADKIGATIDAETAFDPSPYLRREEYLNDLLAKIEQ